MAVTPAGLLAEPLNDVKTVMVRSPSWQTWAGNDYADRVHLNANRTQIEVENGVLQYFNHELSTPFIVLWMPDWLLPIKGPAACHISAKVIFFVQDKAKDRNDHAESANTFLTDLGGLIDDISKDFDQQEGTQGAALGTPAVTSIEMAGMPIRTDPPKGQDPINDMWTSTFILALGPEV